MIKNILRIRTGIAVSLMLVFTLAGCGSGGGYGSSNPAPNPAATVQVVACPGSEAATVTAPDSISFNLLSVTINAGQVVKWTNLSGVAHTVTSTTVPANGTFNAALPIAGSVCLKFTAAGTFNYRCSIHTNMTGTVIVN